MEWCLIPASHEEGYGTMEPGLPDPKILEYANVATSVLPIEDSYVRY
jgi:hypothetical protein